MEQSIAGLFSTMFLVFALVIAIVVHALRSVIEAILVRVELVLPNKVKAGLIVFWQQWVLRALPLVIGGLLAGYLPKYPYPTDFAATKTAHVFFGIIAGLFSSTIYDLFKFHINKYLPDEIKKKIDSINPLSQKKE
jgi:hypothetical protein